MGVRNEEVRFRGGIYIVGWNSSSFIIKHVSGGWDNSDALRNIIESKCLTQDGRRYADLPVNEILRLMGF